MIKKELIIEVLEPYILANKTKSQIYSLLGKCVGALWEMTLPIISGGKYKFVDASGYDFSDGTEAKTFSIRANPNKPGGNSYSGLITNVANYKGKFKSGDLRVAVQNAAAKRVDFFLIPAEDLPFLATGAVGPYQDDNPYPGSLPRIPVSYNIKTDAYGPKIAKYQVDLETVAA